MEDLDKLFYFASRLVITIPIIVLILALILKLNNSSRQIKSIPEKQILTPTPTKSVKIASPEAMLDLKGPFICQLSSQDATISAYIKDKKILAEIKKLDETTNYILNSDCLYIWTKDKSFTGVKKCGLSSYINLMESFISSGLLSLDSLFSSSELKNSYLLNLKETDFQSLFKTCKKQSVDERLFILPTQILFKNF